MELNQATHTHRLVYLSKPILKNTQQISFYCARVFVLLAIICLPYSHFLVNQLSASAAIFAILAGEWREKWNFVRRFSFIWLGALFVGLHLIGLSYSAAPFNKGVQGLTNVTKILYLLCFLPLFACPRWRAYAIHCLIFTVLLAIGLSLLAYFNVYHIDPIVEAHPKLFPQLFISRQPNIIINAINFSVLACFCAFVLLNKIADNARYRVFYALCLLIVFYYLWVVSGERTGYFSCFLLISLFIFQRYNWPNSLLIAGSLMLVMFVSFYSLISPFQARISDISEDINLYKSGDYHSSIGYRLVFAKHSLALIKDRPMLGQGTGGFKGAFQTMEPVANDQALLQFNHPHNEYILTTVEVGMVGLIVLLAWIGALWTSSLKLPRTQRRLVQALVLNFMLNGITNIALAPTSTGFLLILFASVLFASRHNQNSKPYVFNRREVGCAH